MALIWSLRGDWNTEDWRDRAACRSSDLDLFFPIGATGPAVEHIEAAKAVCRQCAVRAECLEFALVSNQEAGVWGGTTEEERRRLRRARRDQPGNGPFLGPVLRIASAEQAVELSPDDGVALTR